MASTKNRQFKFQSGYSKFNLNGPRAIVKAEKKCMQIMQK